MSDKLSPRPTSSNPLYDWKELDNRLQSNLKAGNPDERYLVIQISDFKMTADEMEEEATKQGYVVSYPSEDYMRFD